MIIKKRSNRPVLIIFGPTGAGKTDLALRIAEHTSAKIVNNDIFKILSEPVVPICHEVAITNWNKRNKKWNARIRINYIQKHIGTFDTVEEATTARKNADIDHGFLKNHGRREGE